MALPMAVVLSRAQPVTKIVPETPVFDVGVSILTLGSALLETVTVTLAAPVSGVGSSLSVADIVMVCGPGLNGAVSNE